MSSLAGSNSDEPPRKKFQPSSSSSSSSLSSPSLFSLLPLDIVLNILARVPKRYYPIISCVSKNLRSLVNSPDIYKTQFLLGKYYLYICFMDETYLPIHDYWYTLRRIKNSTTENLFVSIEFSDPPEPCDDSKLIAVGPEIFLIPGCDTPSSSFRILDTRSKELHQGPSLLVERRYNCHEIDSSIWIYGANDSFDMKVCALSFLNGMTCYDTRDGSWERSELHDDEWWNT